MADPFGIIGVVGVAAQVIKAGVELGLDWKDVPEDSKAFIREVKILQRVLYEVNAHVEKTPGFADMLSRTPLAPTSPGAQAEDIPTLLSTCKDGLNAELDNLRQELQKRSTGHHLGWERVKGAFKSKRTRDAVQDLSRACQNLINSITTGVGIGTWKEVADFRKEHREWQASATKSTGEIKQGAQDREAEELRDRVLRWLSPLDFQTKQNETLSRRQPGTCQWFLDSKEYREWLDATGKTLFCPGIPGAGKTVLASTVINDISFRFEHEPRVVVLFLFFDYQREDEQTLDGLLASLVRQMAQQIPQLPEELGRLYQKHKHSRGPPTAELLPSFTSISHQLSKIYIILDALDECRISEDFRTRFLSQMHGMQRESRFNLLVTSRHIPEIANEVDAQATLEIRAHDADVSRYLDASISGARSKLIKDHREYVTRQISDSVDGMFLLAKLSLDEVKNKRTLANLRRALASLHKGEGAYERAYEQAMGRIREQDKDSRELAEAVLQWMIFPRRRLELKEVQHALAVEIGSSTFDEENIPSPEDMVSVCAGLVTLSPAKCDVDFVHYTTHDYFEQSKDRLFPGAQSLIARTLLTYLNSVISPAIGGMTTDQVGETYPLCSYAVRHWGNHAQDLTSCDPAISRFLQDRTQAAYLSNFNYLVFIANHSSRALFMARPMDRVVPLGPDEPLLPMTLLHYAALFGLEALAAGLLREHAVDQQDRRGRTALHYAAGSGNTGFVRLLMEEKANIGIADVEGMTPLGLAARLHHQTTCQVLCERGANPNSGMIYQKSILMAIFQSPRLGKKIGSETDIARLLIDYGADIDAKNAHGCDATALRSKKRQHRRS
ncbi:hypothetical protein F4780DRAFT_655506 [Xylariomycetidae sp. FL0641]|nr:hypothetical protein F4780DRAFT_655506 [Xylariomycetidae sp. FL0641]